MWKLTVGNAIPRLVARVCLVGGITLGLAGCGSGGDGAAMQATGATMQAAGTAMQASGGLSAVAPAPAVVAGKENKSLVDTINPLVMASATATLLVSAPTPWEPTRGLPNGDSEGDMWYNTWADDGNLYASWGDGKGPNFVGDSPFTHCGIVRLSGHLATATATIMQEDAPQGPGYPPLQADIKPSSLLAVGSDLYGAFHSPQGYTSLGFLAVSHDYGATWQRFGYPTDGGPPSPWTQTPVWQTQNAVHSHFCCLMFINEGQAFAGYGDQGDGYVYALGVTNEYEPTNPQMQDVYLCRVPASNLTDFSQYQYWCGASLGFTLDQSGAKPLREVAADGTTSALKTLHQGSALYHKGLGAYIFCTDTGVYEAAHPWGPWTHIGDIPQTVASGWQGGYQPGIVARGTDSGNLFHFTMAGPKGSTLGYSLHIGEATVQIPTPSPTP